MKRVQVKNDLKNLICRFQDDDVLAIAGQLAYSFLLSFFPFLIVLMTLIGYSSIRSEDVLLLLKDALPNNAYELIHNTVVEIVESRQGNLLSVSIIFALWTASSGFGAAIKGLNKAYDEREERSFLKVQLISLLCTIALAFIIIATLLLLVFGQLIGDMLVSRFGFTEVFTFIWNIIRYGILLFSMIFTFAAVYRYTPCRRLTWKEVIPGAVFSTFGWIIVSIGFAYYVNNFANYSRIYGSIGAVIVLLIWLFLGSTIIITGGEVNATLAFDREGKQKVGGKKY